MPFLSRRGRVKPRTIVRDRHRKPLLAEHDPDLDVLRMAAVDRVPDRLLQNKQNRTREIVRDLALLALARDFDDPLPLCFALF